MEETYQNEVPAYAKVKRGVRFALEDQSKKEDGITFLVEGLFSLLDIQKEHILAIYEFPRRGYYDVIWFTDEGLDEFWRKLDLHSQSPVLVGVAVIPHFPKKERIIVVRMYSPYVPEDEIVVFLKRYCLCIEPTGKVLNQYGFWTGKRKFKVKFQESAEKGIVYPPSRFKIGPVNGDLFFSGMDCFCRKCKEYGHMKEECSHSWCGNCEGMGHNTTECKEKRRCNLCGKEGHLYRRCPERKEKQEERKEEVGKKKSGKEAEVKRRVVPLERERQPETKSVPKKDVKVMPKGKKTEVSEEYTRAEGKEMREELEQLRTVKNRNVWQENRIEALTVRLERGKRILQVLRRKVRERVNAPGGNRFFETYRIPVRILEHYDEYGHEDDVIDVVVYHALLAGFPVD